MPSYMSSALFQPITIVPENLEPPQLLDLIGDKLRHPGSSDDVTNKHPTHTLPMLFACEVNRGVVTFTQLQQPVAKTSLKSDKCYLLSYKDLVCTLQRGIATVEVHVLA